MRVSLYTTAIAVLFTALLSCGVLTPVSAADNLKMDGTLVADPCELDPATSTLEVDFKEVFEKELYLNTRTPAIPFTIRLINCDLSLGNQVQFTFSGSESTALPGYLTTTGSAKGIAIGIEEVNGMLMPVNKTGPEMKLDSDSFSLTLQGFVQGEPDAIQNENIIPGDFAATATFEASYP